MGMACSCQPYNASGGGAGGYSKTITSSVTAGTVLTVTVGAAGASGAGLYSTGGAGGGGEVIITYS